MRTPIVALALLFANGCALRLSAPVSRRSACSLAAATALLAAPIAPSVAATGGTSGSKGKAGLDEVMDGTIKAAATPEAAKKQIVAAYQELGTLLLNMDTVTKEEGGDGIRRVLGTVGTTSPVYLIEPAFRLLFEKDDTLPMEYIENVEQIMRELQDADSQAYSANFITFSSAKGKPEDFYKRASEGIVRARTRWAENAKMLQIDL